MQRALGGGKTRSVQHGGRDQQFNAQGFGLGLKPAGSIDAVADDGPGRVIGRADFALNKIAQMQANADPDRRAFFFFQSRVERPQRRTNRGRCIQRRAGGTSRGGASKTASSPSPRYLSTCPPAPVIAGTMASKNRFSRNTTS